MDDEKMVGLAVLIVAIVVAVVVAFWASCERVRLTGELSTLKGEAVRNGHAEYVINEYGNIVFKWERVR